MPKFGQSHEAILKHDGRQVYEKICYSMVNECVRNELEIHDLKSVVLYGAETHICIRQTALDLLEMGYTVYLVVDAVSSISKSDR